MHVGGRELPQRRYAAQTAWGGTEAGGRTPGTDWGDGAQRGQENRREATEQGQYTSDISHNLVSTVIRRSAACWSTAEWEQRRSSVMTEVCVCGWQVRELEAELEAEQRRSRDLAAEVRKLQRLLQEQKQQADDERRLAAEANEQINQLQARIKTLKRQLEEAVWIHSTQ